MSKRIKEIPLVGLLAALIAITGMIKLPGLVPGTEFQLSAPVAVAIAGAFGFRLYLISGVIASLVSLAFSMQTILSVALSMTFRVAAGGLILLLGNSIWVLLLAGPVGTVCGRLVLALITNTNVWVLLAAASVGMVYTAIAAYPTYRMIRYFARLSGFTELLQPKRNVILDLLCRAFCRKRREEPT